MLTILLVLVQVGAFLNSTYVPECFDCHLSMYPCMNWATCSDATGKCVCPAGFGANDCGQPQCGSLARKDRPLRESDKSCRCDDGWTGINCNGSSIFIERFGSNNQVCTKDNVCDSLNPTGMNGTCYNSMTPVKKNHMMCDVKNSAIVNLLKERTPQLTLGCDHESSNCHFEFWAGEVESFFCDFKECKSTEDHQPDKNVTTIVCPHMQCKCYPERLLCGEAGGINFSEWFDDPEEGPYGPGTFVCDESQNEKGLTRKCTFSEGNMNQVIEQFFGDPFIKLDCPIAGECMHYTQVPGYKRPEFKQGFPMTVIVLLSVGSIGLFIVVIVGCVHLKRKSDRGEEGYVPLHTNEQDGAQLRQDMMSHHTPCTIMFRNIRYTIETKKKVQAPRAARTPEPLLEEDEQINMSLVTNTNQLNVKQKMKQVVLEGIQGMVKPGQVMAIIGGSGAGKTTLLDILARKNKSGNVSGDILCNGIFMDYDHYRSITGYVDQEDTLMDTLTVYETIMYSALLRLPKKMHLMAKQRRVHETMMELGIAHIANKRIGSPGNRGLSGGEKRRVSIACELVTSPSILFLDEPTSGLDAYNAYNVIECLVGLARDYHRSVIFTIHQPRSNIYALFDQLILLSKGRVVYSGPAQEPAIEHFANIGYECPMGFNIADYLVDLTMHAANSNTDALQRGSEEDEAVDINDGVSVSSSMHRSNIRAEQESFLFSPKSPIQRVNSNRTSPLRPFQNPDMISPVQDAVIVSGELQPMSIVEGHLIKPYISEELMGLIQSYESSTISRRIRSEVSNSLAASYPSLTAAELEPIRLRARNRSRLSMQTMDTTRVFSNLSEFISNQVSPSYSRPGANWLDQFRILSGRTFKNLYRNPDLLRTHYAISIIVAIICGLLFWKVDNTLAGFQNRLGVMFFICALFGFGCLSSMQVFASERLIFVRERANRYYAPITYFTSKILFDTIPLRVVPPVILGLICYHMIGLQPELALLGRFLLVLVLFNVTSAACCLAISIIFEDQGVASLVATLVMLFEMLFGGLLLNKTSIPPTFQWMNRVSFFNYAFEALVVNEVAGLTLMEEKFGFKIDVPGALILQTFGLNAQGYWVDVQNLGIMCSVFLGVAFLWLQIMVKERR